MTLLEITLLGIVSESPNHAYQIEKIIENRGIRKRLDIGFSTIYSTLKKLERKHLVESYFSPQENLPGRRVYAITDKGRRRLREQLKRALTSPEKLPSYFEISLYFAQLLSKAELKETLCIYEAELNRLIKTKVNEITHLRTDDPVERALLNRPLTLWQAERRWIKDLINLL